MELQDKKYVKMQNILDKINQKYISLSENDVKRNNIVLSKVVDGIIQKMREISPLFHKLYQKNYYGGSYYENLKIGAPSEYDLDCILVLPKAIEPQIKVSNKPGYVYLYVKNVEKLETDDSTFKGLNNLIKDNYLSSKDVLAWMESIINKAIDKYPKTERNEAKIPHSSSMSLVKLAKSGPALTLKIEGEFSGETYKLDVDLVTCFVFTDEQWPKEGYRKNPSTKKNTFFIVPKSPANICKAERYWRLSFQEQERELLLGYKVLKPTIKVFKKLRDRYNHNNIASYYIKTIFLWELETQSKDLWGKPSSVVLMFMLNRYAEYIGSGKISYFWNKKNNLIENLKVETYTGFANKIKNIIRKVDNEILSDPFIFASFLLLPQEFSDLKQEFSQESPGRFVKSEDFSEDSGIDVTDDATIKNEDLEQINGKLQSVLIDKKLEEITNIQRQESCLENLQKNVQVQTIDIKDKNGDFSEILCNLQTKIDNLIDEVSCLKSDNAKILHCCERMFGKVVLLEDRMISLQKENHFFKDKLKTDIVSGVFDKLKNTTDFQEYINTNLEI